MNIATTLMKPAPEYAMARALIAHLQEDDHLGASVLPEPWDKADQCGKLALSAAQYGLAVAVCPQPPAVISAAHTAVGSMQARLVVIVLTTEQTALGAAAEAAAAVAGQALARCLIWDYQSRGIPYAQPEILDCAPLDTAQYPDLQNLVGSAITLGRRVDYKQYYKP